LQKRQTRKKRRFYGCSRYPECDYITWKAPEEGATAVPALNHAGK